MKNNETSDNSELFDDQKKIRKLRKNLRQIEHLQLLTRPLNSDEKLKVSRRLFYREQLSALNIKYKNVDIIEDNLETTYDSDESRQTSFNASYVSEKEEKTTIISESFEKNVAELSLHFNSLLIHDETESKETEVELNKSKLPVPSPIESKPLPQIKNVESKKEPKILKNIEAEIKIKEDSSKIEDKKFDKHIQLKENSSVPKKTDQILKEISQIEKLKVKDVKPNIEFESFMLPNAHEDLIVSLDICNESKLIVTGRFINFFRKKFKF